jgi:hypothetical protein
MVQPDPQLLSEGDLATTGSLENCSTSFDEMLQFLEPMAWDIEAPGADPCTSSLAHDRSSGADSQSTNMNAIRDSISHVPFFASQNDTVAELDVISPRALENSPFVLGASSTPIAQTQLEIELELRLIELERRKIELQKAQLQMQFGSVSSLINVTSSPSQESQNPYLPCLPPAVLTNGTTETLVVHEARSAPALAMKLPAHSFSIAYSPSAPVAHGYIQQSPLSDRLLTQPETMPTSNLPIQTGFTSFESFGSTRVTDLPEDSMDWARSHLVETGSSPQLAESRKDVTEPTMALVLREKHNKRAIQHPPGYFCFQLTDENNSIANKRRTRTKADREQTRIVRGMGACFRCRKFKKQVREFPLRRLV